MKIIDILNKISKDELPDKTRFKVYSSTEDKSFICEYDMNYPDVIWRICDERCRFNYKIDFMRILNYEVEVIEENKEIEELDNMELINARPEVNAKKINELVRAVNKINKQLEEQQTEDIDTVERELNKMF